MNTPVLNDNLRAATEALCRAPTPEEIEEARQRAMSAQSSCSCGGQCDKENCDCDGKCDHDHKDGGCGCGNH